MVAVARRPFFRRRKACPFAAKDAPKSIIKTSNCCSVSYPNAAKSSPAALPPFPQRNSANWQRLSNVPVSWACCLTLWTDPFLIVKEET